jgi:uncharacterized protein with ParB-like and HNH nuclease domain
MTDASDWIEPTDETDDDIQVEEYELTSSPNDFNISTIFNFIESGAVKIPAFQRNYVWDIKRASKLIESIIIGLPVPQLFLYEEGRNRFLVIDGQQRLMSIYYFIKGRFPRKNKRIELRSLFDEQGSIPDNILQNDEYFDAFKLHLSELGPDKPNKFTGLKYQTLEEYKTQFEMRTIRNVIVKQNVPKDDDSSVYEMFNRLNTGGINLTPQEIRASLYHSRFYQMLSKANLLPQWRRFLGASAPDLHMRDIELLLRAFAMLLEGDAYASSMARFLNRFSKNAKGYSAERVSGLERLVLSFLEASRPLPDNAFNGKSGKFSVTIFESVFAGICEVPLSNGGDVAASLETGVIATIRSDETFQSFAQARSSNKANVVGRLRRAREILAATKEPLGG